MGCAPSVARFVARFVARQPPPFLDLHVRSTPRYPSMPHIHLPSRYNFDPWFTAPKLFTCARLLCICLMPAVSWVQIRGLRPRTFNFFLNFMFNHRTTPAAAAHATTHHPAQNN